MALALVWPGISVIGSLFALLAVLDYAWERVYVWLGVALVAHALEVLLDSGGDEAGIADLELVSSAAMFLACVFVPAVAMLQAGFLDGVAGVGLAVLVVLSAVYRWAYVVIPDDGVVAGLPASWGILAFLLHAFDASPVNAALAIGVALIVSLLPFYSLHPLYARHRPRWMAVAVAASVAAALWTVLLGFPAPHIAQGVFISTVVCLAVLSIEVARRRRSSSLRH